jgi:hypothetical protein
MQTTATARSAVRTEFADRMSTDHSGSHNHARCTSSRECLTAAAAPVCNPTAPALEHAVDSSARMPHLVCVARWPGVPATTVRHRIRDAYVGNGFERDRDNNRDAVTAMAHPLPPRLFFAESLAHGPHCYRYQLCHVRLVPGTHAWIQVCHSEDLSLLWLAFPWAQSVCSAPACREYKPRPTPSDAGPNRTGVAVRPDPEIAERLSQDVDAATLATPEDVAKSGAVPGK